jgi:pimeloyl-ACP methyl ester carboxylesterase
MLHTNQAAAPCAAMKPWPSLAPYGKRLTLRGGELFYYDTGTEPATETLALVHGLGDEADTWRHILPLLAHNKIRVIAPDLPGFGRSLWKGSISIARHADALIQVLLASGAASPRRPAIVAGNSMGAGIAELAAFKRPDIIKGLALIDGCYPFSGAVGRGLLLMGLPFTGRRWYRAFRRNHAGAWQSLYPYYHNLDALEAADIPFLRERVIERVHSANQERGYFASLRSMNREFLFGRAAWSRKLGAFTGKILLLWGERDRIFPLEKTAAFRSLRPDAACMVIADAGHLPQQEKPAETAGALLDFLGSR